MAIRDARPHNDYRRKENQHWEMAGLARQDGDKAEEERHMKLARHYEALANEQGSDK